MQNQISFLCQQCPSLEWSGTLFYTVEGELGEDEFSITTEELYLQDIGTGTYTEYDPGNPDFIKFMMENPRMMTLKQGHIHSHNSMGVFFSGTDTEELSENAEFHNYYLSLIVNNKNEMVAKVAFKATEIKETKSIVTFRGNNGTFKNKEVITKSEDSCVYTYDCNIFMPDTVGESFEARFLTIQETIKKREEEKKKMAKQAATISKGLEERAYGGFNVDKRWSQSELYDNFAPVGPGEKKIKGGQKQRDTESDWDPKIDAYSTPKTNRIWTGSVDVDMDYDKKLAVYDFMVKLLNRDFLCEERLVPTLTDLNNKMYNDEAKLSENYEAENEMYYDSLLELLDSHYINMFPHDQKMKGYNSILRRCIEILETYEKDYPELIEELTDVFEISIID